MKRTLPLLTFCVGFLLGTAGCPTTSAQVEALKVMPAKAPAALVFPPETGDVLIVPLRVLDGDTIDYGLLIQGTGRLYGINAPEVHSKDADEKKAGLVAKDYLEKLLGTGPLRATLRGREKYGRTLLSIEAADGKDVNKAMIDSGNAKPYDGKGPRPPWRTPQ